MKRILKWFGIGVGGVVLLLLAAIAYVYISSELLIRRTYAVPFSSISIPHDSSAIAEGRRLATIRGCFDGCHGDGLSGAVFFDEPGLARIVAPNLTRLAAQYSDEDLERAIRHGVRKDGRSTWVMPSSMFYHLSDGDLGAIIAFLRSAPVTDGPATEVNLRLLGRVGVVLGEFTPQAVRIDHDSERWAGGERADTVAFGRYLALTVCTECHGMDLRGTGASDEAPTPDLAIVGTYAEADFMRLLRTGVPTGDRQLDLMARVAVSRFRHLTDFEIHSLHRYLQTLQGKEQGGTV